eukprot:362824-Chlamydomonas_euryale.AAC.4
MERACGAYVWSVRVERTCGAHVCSVPVEQRARFAAPKGCMDAVVCTRTPRVTPAGTELFSGHGTQTPAAYELK